MELVALSVYYIYGFGEVVGANVPDLGTYLPR